MKFSRETSMKVRTAIKVKLAELGNDVYEELPDYIMVMVANKKSEEQMTEDLALFLGDKTDQFTSWLHSLLSKLQSIVSESAGENRASVRSTGATAQAPTDSGSEHSAVNEDGSCATSSGGSDEASTSNVHSTDEASSHVSNSASVDADSTSKPSKPASRGSSDVDSSCVQDNKDTNSGPRVQKRKMDSETGSGTVKVKVRKADPSSGSSKKVVKGSSNAEKAKSKTVKSKRTDSSSNSKLVKSDTSAKKSDVNIKARCKVSSSVKKTALPKDGETSPGNSADPSTPDAVEDKSGSKIIRLKRL